jgi:hypothetical protein
MTHPELPILINVMWLQVLAAAFLLAVIIFTAKMLGVQKNILDAQRELLADLHQMKRKEPTLLAEVAERFKALAERFKALVERVDKQVADLKAKPESVAQPVPAEQIGRSVEYRVAEDKEAADVETLRDKINAFEAAAIPTPPPPAVVLPTSASLFHRGRK